MRAFARGFLVVVSVLDGLSALVCGGLSLASPDGGLMKFEPLLDVVRTLPLADVFFRDFTWIGIAMLLVLGIPNTVTALMLLRKHARQYEAALLAGVLLLLWTGFELVFMINQLAVAYFAVGAASVALAWLMLRQPASARG